MEPTQYLDIQEEYSDQASFGNHQLHQLTEEQIKMSPHKHIGALTFMSRGGVPGKGSGILISSNTILTAAHNFFNTKTNQLYSGFKFYPGQHGELKRGYEIQDFSIAGKFILSRQVTDDYALIKLKEHVKTHDFVNLSADISTISNSSKLLLYGYPSSKYSKSMDGDQLSVRQWGTTQIGKLLSINQQKAQIQYLISTQSGQSGAPIILEENGKFSIIGIHKGGIKNKNIKHQNVIQMGANGGRLITHEFIHKLQLDVKKLGAQMFRIKKQKTKIKVHSLVLPEEYKIKDLNRNHSQNITKIVDPFLSFNSSIIRKDDPKRKQYLQFLFKTLSTYQGKKVLQLNLLFRASEHKYSAQAFHQKCDDHHDTFTLVKTKSGKIISGFSHYPWNTPVEDHFLNDEGMKAFLLSFDLMEKMIAEQSCRLIQPNPAQGPMFGGGDLWIHDKCDKQKSYINFPTTYNRQVGKRYKKDCQESRRAFSGVESCEITISQYEVYRVIFHDQ